MDANLATVSWQDDASETPVRSAEELDALLDQIDRDAAMGKPTAAVITRSNGDTLAVTLGADESFLNFVPASDDPPYYSSVGDRRARGRLVFYLHGHYSEVPRRCAIPRTAAREAVRRFLWESPLPSNVEWEMD